LIKIADCCWLTQIAWREITITQIHQSSHWFFGLMAGQIEEKRVNADRVSTLNDMKWAFDKFSIACIGVDVVAGMEGSAILQEVILPRDVDKFLA
jgi:hypothetical protein